MPRRPLNNYTTNQNIRPNVQPAGINQKIVDMPLIHTAFFEHVFANEQKRFIYKKQLVPFLFISTALLFVLKYGFFFKSLHVVPQIENSNINFCLHKFCLNL